MNEKVANRFSFWRLTKQSQHDSDEAGLFRQN